MNKYQVLLQQTGLKQTRQRTIMLDVLYNSKGPLSAEDLFGLIKKRGVSMSLSTVYRILESFTDKGLVTALTLETSKQVLYEVAHAHHGHHLICISCSKVIHVEGCPLENYEAKLAQKYRFKIDDHTLNFYGYCEQCSTG